tara:strand:- start:6462 stop:6737 length:276 start_codon:yes stop_codon:yes gene_type:complete
MSHSDTDIQVPITVLSIIMMVSSVALMAMFQDIGKESKALEILAQCKAGEIVTINDTEIHCGIISKELNIKAAQYRAVKNCVKLVKEWEGE